MLPITRADGFPQTFATKPPPARTLLPGVTPRFLQQGPLDASICRRKFVAEVVQALYGSRAAALLDAPGGGGGAAAAGGAPGGATVGGGVAGEALSSGGPSLALVVVVALSKLPSLGRHLVLHAGADPDFLKLS